MSAKLMTAALVAAWTGAAVAASVEATADFALDNVLAARRVRSGDVVPVVRDAAWADGGVTFMMTGAADEVLTEGVATTLTIPEVSHFKVITLGLTAGAAQYSYAYLVVNGEPNVQAETTAAFSLDSRTGTVRRAGDRELIAYSDRWSSNGVGQRLIIATPDGGEKITELSGEGVWTWGVERPYVAERLMPGVYTFTHTDGVETFTARFKVPTIGLLLLFR